MEINYQYPSTISPLSASSGNVANAAAIATFPTPSSGQYFITGFSVTAAGATVGLPVVATMTGILGGTMSWVFASPAGALIGAAPLFVSFPMPVAAIAMTAVVLTLPALGLGNTNAAVTLHGFKT